VDCSKFPTVLTGERREKPVKVFDLVVRKAIPLQIHLPGSFHL
jgi:hypothetical protein